MNNSEQELIKLIGEKIIGFKEMCCFFRKSYDQFLNELNIEDLEVTYDFPKIFNESIQFSKLSESLLIKLQDLIDELDESDKNSSLLKERITNLENNLKNLNENDAFKDEMIRKSQDELIIFQKENEELTLTLNKLVLNQKNNFDENSFNRLLKEKEDYFNEMLQFKFKLQKMEKDLNAKIENLSETKENLLEENQHLKNNNLYFEGLINKIKNENLNLMKERNSLESKIEELERKYIIELKKNAIFQNEKQDDSQIIEKSINFGNADNDDESPPLNKKVKIIEKNSTSDEKSMIKQKTQEFLLTPKSHKDDNFKDTQFKLNKIGNNDVFFCLQDLESTTSEKKDFKSKHKPQFSINQNNSAKILKDFTYPHNEKSKTSQKSRHESMQIHSTFSESKNNKSRVNEINKDFLKLTFLSFRLNTEEQEIFEKLKLEEVYEKIKKNNIPFQKYHEFIQKEINSVKTFISQSRQANNYSSFLQMISEKFL